MTRGVKYVCVNDWLYYLTYAWLKVFQNCFEEAEWMYVQGENTLDINDWMLQELYIDLSICNNLLIQLYTKA